MPRISCEDAQEYVKELKRNQRDFVDQLRLFSALGDEDILERLGKMQLRQREVVMILSEHLPIGMNFEKAKEVMGKDYYGLDEVQKAFEFGIGFNPKHMEAIPFSPAELREAKENNQYLIYRFDKEADGARFDASDMKANSPDSESKRILENIWKNVAIYKLTGGWRLAQLKPFAWNGNYFDRLQKTAEALHKTPQFAVSIQKVKKSLETNIKNKSVSDDALMSISERELGSLNENRHSLVELYYDGMVTKKLPGIIRSYASTDYITSDAGRSGFNTAKFMLKDDGSIETEVGTMKLADTLDHWSVITFQRSE